MLKSVQVQPLKIFSNILFNLRFMLKEVWRAKAYEKYQIGTTLKNLSVHIQGFIFQVHATEVYGNQACKIK